MPTADSDTTSSTPAPVNMTLDPAMTDDTKKVVPTPSNAPINDNAMGKNTPPPAEPMVTPTMPDASTVETGAGMNTMMLPASVSQPTKMDEKKCGITECQSLWDQRFDQYIPHPELNGNMLAPEISNADREKRYKTQQEVRGLAKLINMFKQHDKKGSDRMLTTGLEGPGYSGTQTKDGSIKILNLNVIPGADGQLAGIGSQTQEYMKSLNNAKTPKDKAYSIDTTVDLSPSLGVPSGEQFGKNYSSRNQKQLDSGILNYMIPLNDKKQTNSPYTYVPQKELSTGKKGDWKSYNDGDFSKYNLGDSNKTQLLILCHQLNLPLPSSQGVYFDNTVEDGFPALITSVR